MGNACVLEPGRLRAPNPSRQMRHSGDRELPGDDHRARALLGRLRVRADAAVPHGARRRHDESEHVSPLPRTEAVERRLRRARDPTTGRPLRRESLPVPALLPVPGRAQAGSGERPRPLLVLAGGARHRPPPARHAPGRGRLGAADARRLGPRLGSLVRRDGDHAVDRTSSSSEASTSSSFPPR